MISKNYRNDFDRIMNRGINYFDAKRILIEKMEQVKTIDINYNYENRKKYCGKCDTEIVSKNDYIIEETNYVCFVWYQCSNCQEVNLLVS
ncbi:MAG: hypothetical protein E3J90_07205 [Promethearchaeota archaeon]|nr:MAG: hypothetical protein E3J90_07205 [Candidatus Lokiarchaeota archaeon]